VRKPNRGSSGRGKERSPQADTVKIEDLARQIEQRLTSIRQHLRKPLEAEFACGHLTGPQRSVMAVVVTSRDPLRIREVTAAVGLAQSTVSGIVERLVQAGMLVRLDDQSDARASRLAPSPRVRTFLEKKMPQLTLSPLLAALRAGGKGDAEEILAAITRLDELLATNQS
jgi:MarR family transcriptional regulator, organic hydroperoxide resistance regulator